MAVMVLFLPAVQNNRRQPGPRTEQMRMKRKLGTYLIAAFFVNVFAIISIGGVCILMVREMVHNISQLEEESENVTKIDDISNKIYKMIFSIHNSILELEKEHVNYALNIIEDAEQEVKIYRESEQEGEGVASADELALLGSIQENLSGIKKILRPVYEDFAIIGAIDEQQLQELERYGYNIQNLAEDINKVHFRLIADLVSESYSRMYFILLLYLVSSGIGILASCVGYIVLTRNTVTPIMDLASATEKVATGDLSIRVKTSSQTEIATLYESFNVMTKRLEEHERQRENFSRELEKQVRERTSELRESEESLRKAQAELIRMERIATLGQIATTVNHEIKTPLNSLYMNLQLLTKKINQSGIDDGKTKERMLTIAAIIDSEIIRINEIIEEFVKYARFSAPELKEKELNPVVAKIAEMISQSAKDSEVAIELCLADEVGMLLLDENKIIQALLNLCMNAIQAMPYGGRLTLATEKAGEQARIIVADTGKGIAPEDLDKIFEPFFSKKEGGLGFGLSIVQRIVEDHHGQITCQSTVGKGTTFEILLPLAQAPAA